MTTKEVLVAYLRTPKLRNRLLITLGLVAAYLVALQTSSPGVDPAAVAFCRNELTGWYATINMMSGGAIAHVSPVALGVTSYITAAIMWMLLARIIPTYARNPQKAKRHGVIFQGVLGTALLIRSAFSLSTAAHTPGGLISGCSQTLMPGDTVAATALLLIGGSLLLVGAALLITRFGIGNGFAIIIGVGILVSVPFELARLSTTSSVITVTTTLALFLLILIAVFITSAKHYTWNLYRSTGDNPGDPDTPVVNQWKVPWNPAGLIPAVLATILVSAFSMYANIFRDGPGAAWISEHYSGLLSPARLIALTVVMFVMVFYQVIITYDSDAQTDTQRQRGEAFAGIEPGEPTRKFIDRTLEKKTTIAAIGLTVVAVLPELFAILLGTSGAIPLGGTTMLVAVAVALSVWSSMSEHATGKPADNAALLSPLTILNAPGNDPGEDNGLTDPTPMNRAQRRAAARKPPPAAE